VWAERALLLCEHWNRDSVLINILIFYVDGRLWTGRCSIQKVLPNVQQIELSRKDFNESAKKGVELHVFAWNPNDVSCYWRQLSFLCIYMKAWFPPRRLGFDPGSGQVRFVVDKVMLGQVFSEYYGFPCQSSFHQLLHNHPHLSSGAGTIDQKWPQYKGLSPTPLAIKKRHGLVCFNGYNLQKFN
jgi:hypothetical protein